MTDDTLDPTATPEPTGDEPTTPQEPTPVELADDALVTVKINGEDKQLPWSEARQGIMMHGAFTQKTQSLAEERRAFEQQQQQFGTLKADYEQRVGQLRSIFEDPQKVQQLALALYTQRSQQPPQQEQPLTQANLQQWQQQQQQQLQQQQQQWQQNFLQQQQQSQLEGDLDTHTDGLLKAHPQLKAIEGIKEAIYGRVAALGPRSIDEAKELTDQMVTAMSKQATDAWENEQKRIAVDKANAAKGIEQPGGTPVLPKMPDTKNLEELDDAFKDFLTQADRANR